MGNGPKFYFLNMRRWSHKEMEIWDRRCDRCLELVLGDFGLEVDGAAPDLW